MKLTFCCVCGRTEDLHQHHIVPKVLNKNINDTITLCAYHHDVIHQVQRNRWDTHGNMVRSGMEKRKKLGLHLGRKAAPITLELIESVKNLSEQFGARETMRRLKIGTKLYYRILRDEVVAEQLI